MLHNINKLFFCLLPGVFLFSVQGTAQFAEKPNIIFIVLDDLNDYVEGLNGHPQVETPWIKTIAAQGTSFTRAYCPSPQCGPSRMSMLTGKDAQYTNIFTNTDIVCPDFSANFTEEFGNAEVLTLPQFLKDSAGYFTYGINKVFHCHEDYPDFDSLTTDVCSRGLSWNLAVAFPGGENHDVSLVGQETDAGVAGLNYSPIDDSWENQMYDYIAIDSAIAFLESYTIDNAVACGKPLFLAVGLRRPHNPLFVPAKYYSADYFPDFYHTPFNKPYNDPYNAFPYNGVVLPPQPLDTPYNDLFHLPFDGVGYNLALETGVHENMLQAAQSYWGELPEIDPALSDIERLEIIRKSIRANAVISYLAAVTFVDAQIGRLYEYLLTQPALLNNSIIIITSDNGYALDEKQHWRKGALWETDIRIPLIITDMRNTVPQVCDKTVSLLDLYPTLAELLDVNQPLFADGSKYLDGQSLVPLLENPNASWSRPVLTSFRNKPLSEGHCFPQYSVRDDVFHYIFYTSNDTMYGQDSTCNETSQLHEEEFYEVGEQYTVDPHEWDNKIYDDDYLPAIRYLQQWLPDSSMYMQKAFETQILNSDITCFYEQTDTLLLQAAVFDTSGLQLSDFSGYTLQWSNNLTPAVFYGEAIAFHLNALSEIQYTTENRILVYLHVFDSAGRNIGFDVQYFYINPAANTPEVTFTTNMINGGITVEINDYEISGTYTDTWWDFGDGTVVHDLIPAPHHYTAPGTYVITHTIRYGNDTSCVKVYQNTVTATNVNPENLPINLFPNPAQTQLTFALGSYEETVVTEIFDIVGKKMFAFTVDSTMLIQGSYTFDISGLHNGQYIIRCTSGSRVYAGRFIVMR